MDHPHPFTPAFFTPETECAVCEPERTARSVQAESCDSGEAHIIFEPCDGAQSICLSSSCQDQMTGRVLDVTATLQNVCPGRRSAVGVSLYELDEKGTEHARGFRAVSVPAHHGKCNRDVQLETIRFLLPEDMSLQRRRHFICRMSHHYLDSDGMWG